METIGDNLLTILGMIPVRDRAGIARSNMAVEAQKSRQQLEGQGQPQAPPQFKPPQELMGQNGQLQIPENMQTAFASGKSGARPPAPKAGLSAPLAGSAPPPSQERVITSSPAAAPSPAVQTQASDVLLAQYEQQQRQQKMRQILASVGMMANAFNRHPDAGSTQAQLAGMASGGGHGGGGGGLGDLKTILDMRKDEQNTALAAAARQRSIDALVAQGIPREQATVETDNNLHTQRLGLAGEQAREAIRRDEQIRKDLDNPAAIAELAQMYHMTPAQMQTAIRNGTVSKFTDPAVLAEVRDKHALAGEREQKTAVATADFATRDEARQRPDAVAARYSAKLGRPVNPGEVLMASSTEDGWKKFNEENLATGQAAIADKRSETAKREQETRIIGTDFASRERARTQPAVVAAELSEASGRPVSAAMVKAQSVTEENWREYTKQFTEKGQVDIGSTRATADKARADTARTEQETGLTSTQLKSWAEARKKPSEFMETYSLTPEQMAPIIDDFPAYRKFMETAQPLHDELQRRRRDINADERAVPGKPLSTTAQVIGIGKETPNMQTVLDTEAGKGMVKEYQTDLKPKAEAAKQAIEGRGMIIGNMFSGSLRSGSKFSQLGLDVRKTIATTLKLPVAEADLNTDAFFKALGHNILGREAQMKGVLSDTDMKFVRSLNGDMTTRPEVIRTLQHIEEKLHRAEIEAYRERYTRDQANPDIKDEAKTTTRQFTPPEQPAPTPITDAIVREVPKGKGLTSGLQEVKAAVANGLDNDPEIRRHFDQRFGYGMFKHYAAEVRGAQ